MKPLSSLKKTFCLLLFFSILHTSIQAQCKISEIINKGKINIVPPYLYDGFVVTQLTLDNKTKVMQTQFTALKGQLYKLYFCTSGFDEELNVLISNTTKTKTPFEPLNVKTQKDKCIIYEITKSGNYIIEYKVPLAENAEYGNTKKECIVMLISYKSK